MRVVTLDDRFGGYGGEMDGAMAEILLSLDVVQCPTAVDH